MNKLSLSQGIICSLITKVSEPAGMIDKHRGMNYDTLRAKLLPRRENILRQTVLQTKAKQTDRHGNSRW